MIASRRNVLAGLGAAGLTVVRPVTSMARQDTGCFIEFEGVPALGLPDQRLSIWLPPGYDLFSARYRVLYMHDAQNLFDPAYSNFNKVWAADKAMLQYSQSTESNPWIIVGIWSPGVDRYRQYMPQPAYQMASSRLREQMDEFAQGTIDSRAYINWISSALKPWVDRSFRTSPASDDTAIIGSSMGGLISLYAFLEYPDVFGRAGCVSTHWPGIAPQSVEGVDTEMLSIWSQFISERLGDPDGRKLWFDHGTATLDRFYAPYQSAIDALIAQAGWTKGKDWESRSYPGAEHEENAWAARLPEVFDWLLS